MLTLSSMCFCFICWDICLCYQVCTSVIIDGSVSSASGVKCLFLLEWWQPPSLSTNYTIASNNVSLCLVIKCAIVWKIYQRVTFLSVSNLFHFFFYLSLKYTTMCVQNVWWLDLENKDRRYKLKQSCLVSLQSNAD